MECIKLCPELGVLNEKEALVIILTYDYYSPFHKFPDEEKKRKALYHVYGNQAEDTFFTKSKIKIAAECYHSLQYNHKQETIKLYYTKIDDLNKDISKTKDEKAINDSLKSVKYLRSYIKELEKEVLADDIEAGVVVGGKEIGFLENLQQNRSHYLAIKKTK